MTATEAEVEAAARALCDAYYGAGCWDNTRVGSERHGIFTRKATTALAAVEPLIRERLAQEVEALDDVQKSLGFSAGIASAAITIRGGAS